MYRIVAAPLFAIALASALACASRLPIQPPLDVSPLTLQGNQWRVTDHVLLVSDASGSMYSNETFPEAKALTQSFVRAMPAADVRAKRSGGYQAGLLGFGGDDRIASPLASFDRNTLAQTADSLHIMGAIDGMGGDTPFHHVLDEAGSMLGDRAGRAAVVIFSDGMADTPHRALDVARGVADARGGAICFHGVQTGNAPEGRSFLRELAQITECGSYRSAASVQSPGAFAAFAREVFADAAPQPPPPAEDPCADVVRLRGVEFGFDKAEIRPEAAVVLDVAVEHLQACRNWEVLVAGHTDATGPEAYNQRLSERRAEAVKRYLVEHDIAPGRIRTQGFGESQPIATNTTREGRARNRRVELTPSR